MIGTSETCPYIAGGLSLKTSSTVSSCHGYGDVNCLICKLQSDILAHKHKTNTLNMDQIHSFKM